jgi:RNA polymerase sigma-70 factor (ECF subfamily)
MAEGGTPADFERWVEPHLTTLARYAARQVGPADRDDVVQQTLIRAYQRWSTYDASRGTPVVWLLGIVGNESNRHHTRQPAREVVELVDTTAAAPPTRDVDLDRAIVGLRRQQRLAVDLYYFVGLDLAAVAEVMNCAPSTVTTTLHQARAKLCDLLGDDDDDLMDERLSVAAGRWQGEQPLAPDVPLRRLGVPLGRHLPWRTAVAAAAAVVLVGGGTVAVVRALGRDDTAPRDATSPTPRVEAATGKVVPWRDLEPGHPTLGNDVNGVLVTPYDDVSVTGSISGIVHPGDTLVFDAALTAPGIVSLHPCPDYTIAFGTQTTTRGLNCAQVPYFASLVRSNGQVSGFRPVLPAGTHVFFRMRVTVPDEPGRQKVLWTLDGPQELVGFYGIVDVTPR